MTTQAQRDHLDNVTRLIPGYDPWATAGDCVFDYEEAQRACDFFPECLVHIKGKWAGTPIVLEPWQQGVIANLFGWKRPDGTRRYRTVFLYIPRKNAKTTIAAGIALYLLFCDGEGGAEVYSAAANKAQAAICFDTAKAMVTACPALARRGKVLGQSISYEEQMGSYTVVSSKAMTKHGLNPSAVVVDELHAHKDGELYEAFTSGMGSRSQPVTFIPTTADYGRPSICNELHHYAGQVRDGVVPDQSFLPVIYEAKREDDWTSEATWKKANPNYGVSVNPENMREECEKAKNTPARENAFKRFRLNIITEQVDRWLAMDKWDACVGDIDWLALREFLKGQKCYGGLDLASTTDLAALVLVFPNDGNPVILPFYWIPKDSAIEREKRDRVPYLTWAREHALTMTEGNVVDYDVIRRDIGELGTQYQIEEIAFDPFGATHLMNQMTQDGFEMVPFRQGFLSMSGPTKELEKHVIGGTLRHGGHPVLRWNASNVATEQDAAGNIKPSKKRSTEKIDGITGTVMGVGRMMARDLASDISVYESRGLEIAGTDETPETDEPTDSERT